ncbi:MAG TPA: TatD family hydrolase [Acidimicrobiales bacterium]|nr:TatD family hydrolase [Acidimicrobiales bacterium]
MWTDTHCHVLDDADPAASVARAREAGVGRMVLVGTGAAESQRALDVAAGLGGPGAGLWATVGLHPHDADTGTAGVLALLEARAGDPAVVAVGECGLDYHYEHSPREAQRRAFAEQIAASRRLGLALVVHSREAWPDTWAVLRSEGVPERTVFHCFTGGPDEARRCLDLGAYLSFSGIVSFRTAGEVRQAAALCPADRLLVETDAPFLAPVPHRGRRNEPALVPVVGAAVAAARGVDPAEVEEASWAAAAAAFGLP